jgi:hypothetical protein
MVRQNHNRVPEVKPFYNFLSWLDFLNELGTTDEAIAESIGEALLRRALRAVVAKKLSHVSWRRLCDLFLICINGMTRRRAPTALFAPAGVRVYRMAHHHLPHRLRHAAAL